MPWKLEVILHLPYHARVDHWPLHARNWSRVGPPLRPCAEDVAIVLAQITRAVDALILGVTPELVGMALPAGSTITAVDRDPAMIEALFAPHPHRRAFAGDWLALPLASAAVDIAIGDGVASVIGFPADYRALAAELARVVAPGGLVVLRLFAAPAVAETLDDVKAALGMIGSFDALKWRIAMAIQSADRAVAVTAIRDAFDHIVPDRAALAATTGWRTDVIDHIDIYRGSPAIYSFPTTAEVSAAFAPHLVEIARHVPAYELGERCPTVIWRV